MWNKYIMIRKYSTTGALGVAYRFLHKKLLNA